MSIFIVHGFKWPRNDVRVHTVLQEVDDAASNNLMSGDSEWAMRESFTELYPGPMALLPHLRFIEPLNPNDEKFKYPSEPYVFVCDYVVRSEDYIDVTACMAQGISQAAWDAMARLRDEVAKDERIGWYAVHNGDLELAQEERNRMKLQQAHEGAEVTDEVAQRLEEEEEIEAKYSEGLSEGVARMQLNDTADAGNQGEKGKPQTTEKKAGKFNKLFRSNQR